ncbi:cadherin-24-like [Nerophis ophidion]|uniref:cadherin-24-like n=1 Tax=Nerophis ophidion TaxID=159077 RepID=UPI002ADF228B|nr:cadherin-24-like [Nerophis ophidion]
MSRRRRRRRRRKRSWLWNQFFVIEEYRGPEPVLIGRLHTDMDRGDGLTKYLLEGEGAGSVFVIDGDTGNIHVTKSLDREEKDRYHLVATATDRLTGRALEPSSQFVIRVQDINDNPPVFPHPPYSATLPEMAHIGTSIIQVTATDADDATYGNSAQLVYTITEGHQYFSVDPQTGVLRTAVANMDRETQEDYVLVVQAKDMGGHQGGLSGTTTVTVTLSDVNDNPPHFRRSAWSFSVSELAAPGVEVGRLTATDADVGENALLEFSIMDTEEAQTFNVSGREREAVIVLNKLLDYESRNSYSFTVEVSNPVVDARYLQRGPFKDQAVVRVMVLNADEPPRFSQARYHLDVSENCPSVCAVGRVHAVDPDTGQSANVRYSIDPQSDPEALFRIASDTGLISAVAELDRERERWHNITAIATQRDNPDLASRVVVAVETLDQNDNAPELDREYRTSVCDSSAAGQVIQVLRAVDRDPGDQDSPVHFSIAPESSSALKVSIRESGGVTASLVLRSALEPLPRRSSSPATLRVPVVLRDAASGLASTGTVTVSVCPCLQGGMRTEAEARERRWERRAVCRPAPSASPSLVLSLVASMAALACATTLLVACALSLLLRRRRRDARSACEDDDVRENIISYDDEGGGEADTAAFDITALQSMHRIQHATDIWQTRQTAPRPRTYSLHPGPDPQHHPLYGRLCYSIHTLPALADRHVGTMEAGVPLGQLTRRQQAPEPPYGVRVALGAGQRRPPETEGGALSEKRRTADVTQNQNLVKTTLTQLQSGPASLSGSDPAPSSFQSPGGSSSNQTPISTATLPGFPQGDSYSVVGSLKVGGASSQPRKTSHEASPLVSGAHFGLGGGRGAGAELCVEDLLRLHLDRVTSDPSQPPYDSLQTYQFEGRDSRAESLSSLGSEGGTSEATTEEERTEEGKTEEDKMEEDKMAELNVRFQRLLEVIRERKRRKEQVEEGQHKEAQRWDF